MEVAGFSTHAGYEGAREDVASEKTRAHCFSGRAWCLAGWATGDFEFESRVFCSVDRPGTGGVNVLISASTGLIQLAARRDLEGL